jgi:hypothetical protein
LENMLEAIPPGPTCSVYTESWVNYVYLLIHDHFIHGWYSKCNTVCIQRDDTCQSLCLKTLKLIFINILSWFLHRMQECKWLFRSK